MTPLSQLPRRLGGDRTPRCLPVLLVVLATCPQWPLAQPHSPCPTPCSYPHFLPCPSASQADYLPFPHLPPLLPRSYLYPGQGRQEDLPSPLDFPHPSLGTIAPVVCPHVSHCYLPIVPQTCAFPLQLPRLGCLQPRPRTPYLTPFPLVPTPFPMPNAPIPFSHPTPTCVQLLYCICADALLPACCYPHDSGTTTISSSPTHRCPSPPGRDLVPLAVDSSRWTMLWPPVLCHLDPTYPGLPSCCQDLGGTVDLSLKPGQCKPTTFLNIAITQLPAPACHSQDYCYYPTWHDLCAQVVSHYSIVPR